VDIEEAVNTLSELLRLVSFLLYMYYNASHPVLEILKNKIWGQFALASSVQIVGDESPQFGMGTRLPVPPFTPMRLSVCLSVCPVGILTVTHQGAACDAASVHFGPIIRRTDIVVDKYDG